MNDMTGFDPTLERAPDLPQQRTFMVPRPARLPSVFDDEANFETGQRMAKALAQSTFVPAAFQNNLPNCLILIDVARSMQMSITQVGQHLNIIHGRPSWSSQFVIATIRACGLFAQVRYEWTGIEGTDDWGCRMIALDRDSGAPVKGSKVTIALAKAEGWYNRAGSKWKTMPEQMLMYRAGAFFGRIYCGHLLLGLPTTDEQFDRGEVDVTPTATASVSGAGEPATATEARAAGASPLDAINAEVRGNKRRRRREGAVVIDAATGEVSGQAAPAAAAPAAPAAPAPAPAAEASAAPAPAMPAEAPPAGAGAARRAAHYLGDAAPPIRTAAAPSIEPAPHRAPAPSADPVPSVDDIF